MERKCFWKTEFPPCLCVVWHMLTMAMSGLLSSCRDNNGSSHSASVTWQRASTHRHCHVFRWFDTVMGTVVRKGASLVVKANRHGALSHVVKYVLHQQPAKIWYLLAWTADGTVTSRLQQVSLNPSIQPFSTLNPYMGSWGGWNLPHLTLITGLTKRDKQPSTVPFTLLGSLTR